MANQFTIEFEHDSNTAIVAREVVLSGKVQGVGFRPFVYRLAIENHLVGWVRNCVGTVEVHIEGNSQNINNFLKQLFDKKPSLAQPTIVSDHQANVADYEQFTILQSYQQGDVDVRVPTDLFLCDDCLAEFNDPTDRRYRYPFINCTQCGPRYTIIRTLPYDRSNTTMAEFDLCPSCLAEYENPNDRRFHAEPIACPDCGPTLSLHINTQLDSRKKIVPVSSNVVSIDGSIINHTAAVDNACDDVVINDNETVLKFAVDALHNGKVIAVKGIGGYHLVCDATNSQAITRLRKNKSRLDKPLAVMFPAPVDAPFKYVEQAVTLSDSDKTFLLSPARPILLAKKLPVNTNAENLIATDVIAADIIAADVIAPGLNEVGVMLPYSPLHHLLLNKFAAPLVATSANISGEPVLIDNQQVELRLGHIADAYLHHNREIERPADDPVYRMIAAKPRPIRLGRGTAPLEISLPFELEHPILAVGAHMKNTFTLAWNNRAVISPHIGEMGSIRSLEVFENTINDLEELYQTDISAIVCDAHPGYTTTRWAMKQGLPVHKVFHHHAHASAAYYECQHENMSNQDMMVFTWDGVGYGEDGTLWGGETFVGKPAQWQRVATMRPFYLPGAEKAGRQPWRSAAALCWEVGQPYTKSTEKIFLLYQAWLRKINTPQTTSVGRLFDAAAALTDVCSNASFEGQGPMLFEALSENIADQIHDRKSKHIKLQLEKQGDLLTTNWEPIVASLLDTTLSVTNRATVFHASLAHAILDQAKTIRDKYAVNSVSFSGGVFQNRVLTEAAIVLLRDNDFKVCLPELIPVNDANISFGQIIEYGFSQKH